MPFVNYLVIRFSILTSLGIVAAHYATPESALPLKIPIMLFGLLFILWISARNQLHQNIFFGLISYLTFFAIGYSNYQSRLPAFQLKHYSNIFSETASNMLQLKITDVLKPGNYNQKYIATVKAVNAVSATGSILVMIQKDTNTNKLKIDDQFLISTSLKSIPKPLNPGQFNYSKYMETLGVYHQIKLRSKAASMEHPGASTLNGQAEWFRNYLLEKLNRISLGANERAIVKALVLGQKKDLNKELYRNYADAGAAHILAVSGLHVGMIYFLLKFLLSFLNQLKYGGIIKSILLILCLWFFAFVTGLSPSVTRAVTMFTIFAFAETINRGSNTVNNLFISFLILILVNPLWLFHVGFQLSYLAVFSIILIQPRLQTYYKPHTKIDRFFWNIFTVSIAAQLGILPLSLYYFHQFPGLFFITNLVVLPFIGILLGGGILLLILSTTNLLPEQYVKTYHILIKKLNEFINWAASQEFFVVRNIYLSEGKTLIVYFLLMALILLWYRFTFKNLLFTFVTFSALLTLTVWESYESSKGKLVIFHKNQQTLLGYQDSRHFTLYKNDTLSNFKKSYPIANYLINNNIEEYCAEVLPKVFKFRNTKVLVLDSLGIYSKSLQQSIVLLTGNSKVHLERLINNTCPQLIIADGSNYSSYVERWKTTCLQKKLPFHHTGKKGAYIIE